MIFNDVSNADIDAVKQLRDRSSLLDKINQCDPHSVFTPAGDSRNPNKRLIICPFCGNGSGNDHTPVEVSWNGERWLYNCFKGCGFSGDLLKIIATDLHLNLKYHTDFYRALAVGANLIGFPLFGDSSDWKPKFKPPDFFTPVVDDAPDPNYLSYIAVDIDDAQRNLFTLPDNLRRGLSVKTLRHFRFGFLDRWVHPLNRINGISVFPSRRFIIPTSDKQYNAVALDPDRSSIPKKFHKMHAGKLDGELFNKDALAQSDETVLVVEGEFDAASIWQAFDGNISVVAVLGVNNWKKTLLPLLDNLSDKKFLILFDAEPDSRKAADSLKDELSKRGFPAACRFFYDALFADLENGNSNLPAFDVKIDANQILQLKGNSFLHSLTLSIIDSALANLSSPVKKPARASFTNSDSKLLEQINLWQKYNGNINPQFLDELISNANRISSLDNISPNYALDTYTQKFLGAFRYYSFFAHVDVDFFAKLKAAKSHIRKLVKAHKNDSVPFKLDSEQNALLNIDIAKLNNKVESFCSQAKRDHKRFLEQLQLDELNAKANAAHQDYLDNPPSTKKLISDCPVDLILPEGVSFSDKGISITDLDKPVGRNGARPVVIASNSPIVPTKIFRSPSDNVTCYEIAVKARRVWRRVILDGDEIADSKKILRLAKEGGALIRNANHLSKFFADIISLNEGILPEIKTFDQPGWKKDGSFIYPSGGDDYICKRNNVDYDELFASEGNPDAWIKKFDEIIRDDTGNIKRIVLGSAFAAPLLKILHIPNFWLHVQGNKNFAKTPLLKFALSAFGNPAETYLLRSFDSSPKNRVAMAVALNDLPQAIDELETLSSREAAELQKSVYDYVSGIDGQKNLRSGEVRKVSRFRGVRISTGERPILDRNSKAGAFKRCITLSLSKPFFSNSDARKLHIFCEKNFGLFGKQWIQYISDNQEQIVDDFEHLLSYLDSYSSDFEDSNVRAMAASSLAFWHFRRCLNLDNKFELSLAQSDARAILYELPSLDDISDSKRGIDLLASYVNEHPKNFAHHGVHSNTTENALSFSETSGIIFSDGKVGFFQNAFRRICEQELLLPSYEKFLNDLFDSQKIIAPSRREKAKQMKFGKEKKKLYLFKPNVLISIDDDDDTQQLANEYGF